MSKQHLLFIPLLLLCTLLAINCSNAQNKAPWHNGNFWLDEIGKIYGRPEGKALSVKGRSGFYLDNRQGTLVYYAAHSGNGGYQSKISGFTFLSEVAANEMGEILGVKLNPHKDELPWKIKFGMSMEQIKSMFPSGSVSKNKEGDEVYSAIIPGYSSLTLNTLFRNNHLIMADLWWTGGESRYGTFTMTAYSPDETVWSDYELIKQKFSLNELSSFLATVIYDKRSMKQLNLQGDATTMYVEEDGVSINRTIFCTDGLNHPAILYLHLQSSLRAITHFSHKNVFDKSVRDVLSPYKIELIEQDIETGQFSAFAHNINDNKAYKINNKLPLIHIYMKPGTGEVVLEVIGSNANSSKQKPRFEQKLYKLCTPDDRDLLLSEAELKAKKQAIMAEKGYDFSANLNPLIAPEDGQRIASLVGKTTDSPLYEELEKKYGPFKLEVSKWGGKSLYNNKNISMVVTSDEDMPSILQIRNLILEKDMLSLVFGLEQNMPEKKVRKVFSGKKDQTSYDNWNGFQISLRFSYRDELDQIQILMPE